MMNKRSSRLIAWLVALVMILNIAPVTAFADYSNLLTQPLDNAKSVNVHYEPSHGDWNKNISWTRQGDEKTPTVSDSYYSYPGQIAGWSTVANYNGSEGFLFAAGSYIDFSVFGGAVPVDLTLYEIAAIPVTVNVNGKINGQEVSTLYVVPGEKLEKPADPIPYDTYNNGSFQKWLKDDGTEYDFNTIVTEPFSLTASYYNNLSTHTVHFQYNNGSTPEVTITVNDGEKVQRPTTDPEAPSNWGQVFDFWAINEQNVPYDFDTPVTSDLWIGAVYKNAGSDNNNNNNDNNQNTSPSSGTITDFTINYVIPGSYNYVEPGKDIIFDTRSEQGDPNEYYNDNNKSRISNAAKGLYTDDTDPSKKEWNETNKTLSLYYTPKPVKITVHYRRLIPDQNMATDLSNTQAGSPTVIFEYAYKEAQHDIRTITLDDGKEFNLIHALSFNFPDEWIDIDTEHFEYAGYKFGNLGDSDISSINTERN